MNIGKKIFVRPILLAIASCSGGGGGKSTTLTGASGQLCITSDNQYTITGSQTGQVQTLPFEVESFTTHFKGSIDGQTRAVANAAIAQPDSEPISILVWASGRLFNTAYRAPHWALCF
jgi:hypothetical protein